jgi:transposase
LPEIGSISTKQLAVLVGVAPFARDSGPRCAKCSIRGGRAKLRSRLYMAALVASRFNPILRDVYQRLIQQGKPKKVALVALIRKLLIAMHYILKKTFACYFLIKDSCFGVSSNLGGLWNTLNKAWPEL